MVARQSTATMRISLEGRRSVAYLPALATTWIDVPALRPTGRRAPGELDVVDRGAGGMFASGRQLPGWDFGVGAGDDRGAHLQPSRARM